MSSLTFANRQNPQVPKAIGTLAVGTKAWGTRQRVRWLSDFRERM